MAIDIAPEIYTDLAERWPSIVPKRSPWEFDYKLLDLKGYTHEPLYKMILRFLQAYPPPKLTFTTG